MDDISLLEGLLQHYSPTGQEGAAVAYLVEQMQRLRFDARVDAVGNAVGALGDGPQEILLLGHIDTVPGEIAVRRQDERLYGRGAVDAKGSLACFTAAAARLGAQPGWRIKVIGAVAEEGDSRGARYLVDPAGALGEHQPQFLVIGEPSGWERITLGYKGSAWFDLIVQRPMAHTAAQVESACEAAVTIWNQLTARTAEINAGQERLFYQLSPTLRAMHSSQDGFSQTAELRIGFRLPPEWNVAAVQALMEGIAGQETVRLVDGMPAYRAEKNTPLVRAFLSAIRAAGGAPGFTLKTGTSDMNIVAPVWNCPTVAFGPGDSALDHTPEEHIILSEYLKGIDVLEKALRTLCSH